MTQNELKPKPSDEEEEASDSEDEQTPASGNESDDSDSVKPEPQKTIAAPPQSQSGKKPKLPDLYSSGSEESDSDSDSDSPPKTTSSPVKNKRPASSAVVKDAKKAKPNTANGKTNKAESEDSGKSMFSKLLEAKRSKPVASSSKKVLDLLSSSKTARDVDDISTSESEDSGSDSETDSDSPPKKSAVAVSNVKPISSKPMKSKPVKKVGSKTVETSTEAPAPAKNGKKDTKKQLFQRLWSEDDEIAILEGMISYKNERKSDPIVDMVAFHDFIKESLHVDVSRAQLADKIRRLKQKFVNNASRENDGKGRSFLKSHEQKCYELSKLIWGSNSETESKNKNLSNKNGKSKIKINGPSTSADNAGASLVKPNGLDDKDRVMMEVDKKTDVPWFVGYAGMSDSLVLTEEIVKAGMKLVDSSKRLELEAKWRNLKEQELEVYVKRMELLKEQALVVLEAVRSSGN